MKRKSYLGAPDPVGSRRSFNYAMARQGDFRGLGSRLRIVMRGAYDPFVPGYCDEESYRQSRGIRLVRIQRKK